MSIIPFSVLTVLAVAVAAAVTVVPCCYVRVYVQYSAAASRLKTRKYVRNVVLLVMSFASLLRGSRAAEVGARRPARKQDTLLDIVLIIVCKGNHVSPHWFGSEFG